MDAEADMEIGGHVQDLLGDFVGCGREIAAPLRSVAPVAQGPAPIPVKQPGQKHPPLGAKVCWTRRAGRYYFWDDANPPPDLTQPAADGLASPAYSGDPDFPDFPDVPRISTKDGIPPNEQQALIDRLSIDDETLAMDGYNFNHGMCDIHIWNEVGQGILVGMTSRTVFMPIIDDNTLQFRGMSPGKTYQFYEVRQSLRGRRMIVPLDSLHVI